MGGYGSTRWGWRSTRATTDEFLTLDVRTLARRGYFSAKPGEVARGTIFWTLLGEEAGQMGVEYAGANPRRITFHYQLHVPGERTPKITEPIEVVRTACHFGGKRVWFICSGCAARRAILYAVGGVFKCRVCHDLAYASTRESRKTHRAPGRLRHR